MSIDFALNKDGHMCASFVNPFDHSAITVYQQGAHLTSWRTELGEEHLYTSPKAVYADGKAIRGGVPLIFPQFSDLGPLPVSHGFLRTSKKWKVNKSSTNEAHEQVVEFVHCLREGDSEAVGFDNANCTVRYTICFTSSKLTLQVNVFNDNKPDESATNSEDHASETKMIKFGFAFHSYFAVSDVHAVTIENLSKTPYLDDMQDRKLCEPEEITHIDKEIDRIYLNQCDLPVKLRFPIDSQVHNNDTHTNTKELAIQGINFSDTVLWNPWIEKTKKMSDMPPDGYLHFVCVESGEIKNMVHLPAGESWCAQQIVSVRHIEEFNKSI